ncbi:response regulator transcription factor [Solitalea canadensis]|uniref:Response regulator with CheY-like receiver domain and winged-helix DNA-binding domain n=1 Tax=Solitalea canadensis (strain ATCC 29591 / DSM 3403 / JCM 21819 / LMG 8368 / NBRC 15130 / NCIMB 12057 / USAM 9D) TaxID=929556 RepID=H8KS44_SOLCM|nr:response regulator transcription factor [Solitalea canadensis]AFD07832.1 response regulator with CheY-like receiver domain and winged-helix DNA-binding domain [Solitalea canadensis DSM 3403]
MSQSRILLVEDEEHLLEAIKLNLELEGYHVTTAMDGKKALKLIKEERFNLVLLDVMLPEIDGFQVAETIRLQNFDVPILFLTAKNTSEDRVMGLKKGADDYLTKPFNLEELILRVGILVKRSLRNTEEGKMLNTYKIGDKEINFTSFELTSDDGTTTMLTKKEAMLLKLLIERKGEVVSREQILETVWNYDVFPSTRTIDNFILSFRKYFEPNPKEPRYFHSVRGVGYKFTD